MHYQKMTCKCSLSLCLLGIATIFTSSTLARVAIIGGDLAKEQQFPYLATILYHGKDVCGGGIINELFVLTAAHCVFHDNGQIIYDRLHIFAGSTSLHQVGAPAKKIKVHKIYAPKDYRVPSTSDIAVIKLHKAIKWTRHVQKLDLPHSHHRTKDGQIAVIAGFGWDTVSFHKGQEQGENKNGQLRFAEAEILKKGQKGYSKLTHDDSQISAKVKQNNPRGVCHGDSGSPLVYDNLLIGILSIGPSTCLETLVGGIYMRVSYYLNFIEDAVHDRHHEHMHVHEYPA